MSAKLCAKINQIDRLINAPLPPPLLLLLADASNVRNDSTHMHTHTRTQTICLSPEIVSGSSQRRPEVDERRVECSRIKCYTHAHIRVHVHARFRSLSLSLVRATDTQRKRVAQLIATRKVCDVFTAVLSVARSLVRKFCSLASSRGNAKTLCDRFERLWFG